MGQKITEYPQVDFWVKLTKEADKAGATLPHRHSADVRELSKYADMERARFRSAYSVILPASMLRDEQKYDPADNGDEVAADDAPGDTSDDTDVDEEEEVDSGDTESA